VVLSAATAGIPSSLGASVEAEGFVMKSNAEEAVGASLFMIVFSSNFPGSSAGDAASFCMKENPLVAVEGAVTETGAAPAGAEFKNENPLEATAAEAGSGAGAALRNENELPLPVAAGAGASVGLVSSFLVAPLISKPPNIVSLPADCLGFGAVLIAAVLCRVHNAMGK